MVGSDDRLLGIIAQGLGKLNEAQTHFEYAIAFCRKAGYRPELAWSLCDYADLLLDHSNSVRPFDELRAGSEPVEGQHGSTSSPQRRSPAIFELGSRTPRTESEAAPRTDEDKTKAVAMLDESLAISTELGMRPLMERVLSRREILKA